MESGFFGVSKSLRIFLKGHGSKAEGLPEGRSQEFSQTEESHGIPSSTVESFSLGNSGILESSEKELSHVLGMDMVERTEATIEEDDFLSSQDSLESLRIVVPKRSYKGFPRPGNMGRADESNRDLSLSCGLQEKVFNEDLFAGIVVFRETRSIFWCRNDPRFSIDPGGGAHEEVGFCS